MNIDDTVGSGNSFEGLLALIESEVKTLKDKAEVIVDEYYDWWKASNKEVLNLISLGEKVKTGEVGPFLRVHKANNKVYLSWVIWPRVTTLIRKRRDKTFCEHIKPRARGYSIEQLVQKCQAWEVSKVTETEFKLSALRDKLGLLHTMKVDIKRLNKKLNKQTNN